MDLPFFFRGFILGFSIAAPVGPIGVLCIRRTLMQGRMIGFVSGLGAASADLFYGAIAAFSLTTISSFLTGQQFWLSLIGGGFLIYLGTKTFLEKPTDTAVKNESDGWQGAFVSTLFLTLTNPITILAFTAMFAGLGFAQGTQRYSFAAVEIVTGVFSGSAAWWGILSLSVGFLREKFSTTTMIWVNRISGVIILLFGLWAIINIF